jgi:hypothetical protein
LLTPVVDHVGVGSIESIRMRTLHGDTLQSHTISTGAHVPVGVFAGRVHACLDNRAPRECKILTSIQQFVEPFAGACTAAAAPNLT